MATIPITASSFGRELADANPANPGTTCVVGGTELWFGRFSGFNANVMLKFPLPSVGWLEGKQIAAASLTFRTSGTNGTGSFVQKVFLENSASPDDMSGDIGSISSRARYGAGVTFGAFQMGAWNESESKTYFGNAASGTPATTFVTMINDMINAGGYAASADSLNFLFMEQGYPGSTDKGRKFSMGENKPVLALTYFEFDRIWSEEVRVLRHDSRTVRT